MTGDDRGSTGGPGAAPGTPRWLRETAAGLVARVNARGMTFSVDAAETLLAERHCAISEQLRISGVTARKYLDAAALDDLADRLVAEFEDEAPGGDLFTLARTALMTVSRFGMLITALAESLLFFENYPAIDDADRVARMHEVGQLLSVAGLMQSGHTGSDGQIGAPPALFARIARILEVVADLSDSVELGAALRRDAIRARNAAAIGRSL